MEKVRGFFSKAEMGRRRVETSIPRCARCGLYRSCIHPRMQPAGSGRLQTLIIAEAPGKDEDRRGKPLVGPVGQYVRQSIENSGLVFNRDFWRTNALICRPPNNKIEDNRSIAHCRPNLISTIKRLNPKVVLCLGGSAVMGLFPYIYSPSFNIAGLTGPWMNWVIPSRKLNAWVCTTWHPSYIMRESERHDGSIVGMQYESMIWRVTKLARRGKRPYDQVPNILDKVTCEPKPSAAAKAIADIHRRGLDVAWDLETNCLKPEEDRAKIVSCSICEAGKWTIAYPWAGDAIDQTIKLLRDRRIGKIAGNLKFEHRWARRQMGISVRNWLYDTVVGAHVVDHRSNITSVKIQGLLMLGLESWDDVVSPYLQATKGPYNRIDELSIADLLKYNGIDSQAEWEIAEKQMAILRKVAISHAKADQSSRL